jgi:DNA topoisomerase-1
MILFLVESFTKAKTISKYLGKDYLVKATGGHIKDLPEDKLGVDLETLNPTFLWKKGKRFEKPDNAKPYLEKLKDALL